MTSTTGAHTARAMSEVHLFDGKPATCPAWYALCSCGTTGPTHYRRSGDRGRARQAAIREALAHLREMQKRGEPVTPGQLPPEAPAG